MRCISGQCGSRNGNAPVIEGEQSANIGRYPIFANRNTLTPREASKTLAAALQVHARCFPGFPARDQQLVRSPRPYGLLFQETPEAGLSLEPDNIPQLVLCFYPPRGAHE